MGTVYILSHLSCLFAYVYLFLTHLHISIMLCVCELKAETTWLSFHNFNSALLSFAFASRSSRTCRLVNTLPHAEPANISASTSFMLASSNRVFRSKLSCFSPFYCCSREQQQHGVFGELPTQLPHTLRPRWGLSWQRGKSTI